MLSSASISIMPSHRPTPRRACRWPLLWLPLWVSTLAHAGVADPDPSFSLDGIAVAAQDMLGTGKVIIFNGITSQPDGRIIVVGEVDSTTGDNQFNSFIARFLADGSLDSSFNGTGYRSQNIDSLRDAAFEVLVQADGKIVVGGHTTSNPASSGGGNIFVVRYLTDGSLDPDFGVSGGLVINKTGSDELLLGMALRSDGQIVLAGSTNTDGEVDTFFAQLTADGELDPAFGGGDGIVSHAIATGNVDNASGIDLYANGKIAFTGSRGTGADTNTLVGRLNKDGSLDASFGSNSGYSIISTLNTNLRDFGDELLVQPDNSVLIAVTLDTATSNKASLGIIRLTSTGALDNSFGSSGITTIAPDAGATISLFNATELVRDASGKIYATAAQAQMSDTEPGGFIAETAKAVIARLNSDGSPDTSFNTTGVVRLNFGVTSTYPRAASLQGDGKLLLAGRARVLNNSDELYSSYMISRLSGDTTSVDVSPDAFSFTPVSDVVPGAEVSSNTITISGLTDEVQVPLRITNGEYRLNGGAFSTDAIWVRNTDQIQLRHHATALGNSQTTTTLQVGGTAIPFNGDNLTGDVISVDFVSTTRDVDTIPDSFSFPNQTDVALNSWIVSAPITVSGINYETPISIQNGEYSIGCTSTYVSTSGSVVAGNTVCVRQRSATTVSTSKTSTLTIGTISAGFTTTTVATVDTTPDAFSFTDQTGVGRLATITSNSITVSGITAPVSISISGAGGYSIGCGSTFINAPSMISPGESVCIRHLAASNYNTAVDTTLTIGGVSDTFTSTTGRAPSSGGGGGGGGGSSAASVLLILAGLLASRRRRGLA